MTDILETGKRDGTIDNVRILGFMMVVVLHVVSVPSKGVNIESLIDHFVRMAVPVYFMISGFLFEISPRPTGQKLKRLFSRLFAVFVFWEVIYIAVQPLLGHELPANFWSLRFLIYTFYGGGVAWHLWFLPSLALCLAMLAAIQKQSPSRILLIAGAFFILGLVLSPAADILGLSDAFRRIGFSNGKIPVRNGPFFGFIFIVMGALIARGVWSSLSKSTIYSLAVGGFVIQALEGYLLATYSDRNFAPYDFLIGTVPYSLGCFLLAKDLKLPEGLTRMGRLSLGMYCVHLLVLLALTLVLPEFDHASRQILLIALTLFVSMVISFLMSQIAPLNRFVA